MIERSVSESGSVPFTYGSVSEGPKNFRIQNRTDNSMVRIRRSGFLSKHHEFGTLITTYVQTVLVLRVYEKW